MRIAPGVVAKSGVRAVRVTPKLSCATDAPIAGSGSAGQRDPGADKPGEVETACRVAATGLAARYGAACVAGRNP